MYFLKTVSSDIKIPVLGNIHNALDAANHIIKANQIKEVEVFCSKKDQTIAVLKLEAQNSYENY